MTEKPEKKTAVCRSAVPFSPRIQAGRFQAFILLFFFLSGTFLPACTHYTPKPRGYLRIEPPQPVYLPLVTGSAPYGFHYSRLATVVWPSPPDSASAINLRYPTLGATLYGSYFSLPPERLGAALSDCRRLVGRQASQALGLTEKAFSNPQQRVYGSLFLLEGDVASPVQFVLTDSLSRLFRGALYYDSHPNADSLAPLTGYLRQDIIELIQSFSWKK